MNLALFIHSFSFFLFSFWLSFDFYKSLCYLFFVRSLFSYQKRYCTTRFVADKAYDIRGFGPKFGRLNCSRVDSLTVLSYGPRRLIDTSEPNEPLNK